MLPTIADTTDSARGWIAHRREAAQDWWAERTPRGKKITAACAALGTVALIGIVAGASGGSGGSGSGNASSGTAGTFELGQADAQSDPLPEDCVLPGPFCEFEGSEDLNTCLDAIAGGLTGCEFDGICVVRPDCVCFDVPDTEAGTCQSFFGPPADCNRFGACEFDVATQTCIATEDCAVEETAAPSAAPQEGSSAPTASPAAGSAAPSVSGATPEPTFPTSAAPSPQPSSSPSPWPTVGPTSAPTASALKPTQAPTKIIPGWSAKP